MILRVTFGGGKTTPFQVVDDQGYQIYGGEAGNVRFNTAADVQSAFVAAVRGGRTGCKAGGLKGGGEVEVDFPEDCVKRFHRVVMRDGFGKELPPPWRSR